MTVKKPNSTMSQLKTYQDLAFQRLQKLEAMDKTLSETKEQLDQTRLRMERYEQDAITARAEYHAAVRARDLERDRLLTLEKTNSDHSATERAVRDFLDGIEAAIPNEYPTHLKLGSAESATFYHRSSNNGSIPARLGCVLARILTRKA